MSPCHRLPAGFATRPFGQGTNYAPGGTENSCRANAQDVERVRSQYRRWGGAVRSRFDFSLRMAVMKFPIKIGWTNDDVEMLVTIEQGTVSVPSAKRACET